jgi:hypothetical protein
MKTLSFSRLIFGAFALLAFVPVATHAKNRGVRPIMIAKFADTPAVADTLANTTDAWTNIKDYPYEKRADFIAVFSRMVAKFDDKIRGLNARRATMTADTQEWDFAMKELNNARSDVQSKITDLTKTTAETWSEARDRLGVAWDRANTAYDAVKNSTTQS